MADKDPLSIEDTSAFSRPVWATDNDIIVGQDELGNPVYQGSGGRTYLVKPNPEAGGTRPEGGYVRSAMGAIGDIPPVAEWDFEAMGPAMAKGAAAVRDAIWGSVSTPLRVLRGEEPATMGGALEVAGTAATGGLGASVPEGALRIFGGRRATSPGTARSGALAPESVGADSLYRFEIDDSQSIFMPAYVDRVKNRNQISRKTTTVGDVLVHDELFYQYPEIKDVKIILDESLEGTPTAGYFDSSSNTIAFAPSRLQDPEDMKSTLIHELQHSVQETEGFATGDNLYSRSTSATADRIRRQREEQEKQRQAALDSPAVQEYIEPETRKLAAFYAEVLDESGIPFTESISSFDNRSKISPSRPEWGAAFELDNLLKSLETPISRDPYTGKFEGEVLGPYGIRSSQEYSPTLQINKLAREQLKAYELAEKLGKEDLFFEVTSYDEGLFKSKESSLLRDPVFLLRDKIEKELSLPRKRTMRSTPQVEAYRSKKGEVEARNVAFRRDFSLEERFKTDPESTEDIPRAFQWQDEDLANYSKGGLVTRTKQALGEI